MRSRRKTRLVALGVASLMIGAAAQMIGPAAQGATERTSLDVPLSKRGYSKLGSRKGVTVWEHDRSSKVRLAAEGTIPQPPAKVFKALLDYENQQSVMANLAEVRVLKRTRNALWVYQRLDLPVIDDRDFTLMVKFGQSGKLRWIEYHKVSNRGPKARSGVVRVPLHRGSWQLQPTRGGKHTRVRYQILIDLGGWVPMWMAKKGYIRELPEVFKNVERLARKY
jgi:hypothetical protein